jgi:hypothetical protein
MFTSPSMWSSVASDEALSWTMTSYEKPSQAAGMARRQRSMKRSLFHVTMRMETSVDAGALAGHTGAGVARSRGLVSVRAFAIVR